MRALPAGAWAGWTTAIAAYVLVAGCAIAAPLLVYSVTLASFGAAHVLSELRYVDRRFGRGLGTGRIGLMGLLLAGAASARVLGVFQVVDGSLAIMLELSCVVVLAASAADGSGPRSALAIGIAACLAIATLVAPFDTVISLSILHNLTPLAFLWEILPARHRLLGMAMAGVAFIGMPLIVATGIPRAALAGLGLIAPAIDPLGAGPLARHLYVYVPAPLLSGASAIDLFTGAVVAQCAHYAAVIVVLPVLLARQDPKARGIVAWPSGLTFAALVALVSIAIFYRFGQEFTYTRALYGIASSVHAWIEVPLIVIALTRAAQPRSSTPVNAEATLARAETSIDLPHDICVTQPTTTASTAMTAVSANTTVAPYPRRG